MIMEICFLSSRQIVWKTLHRLGREKIWEKSWYHLIITLKRVEELISLLEVVLLLQQQLMGVLLTDQFLMKTDLDIQEEITLSNKIWIPLTSLSLVLFLIKDHSCKTLRLTMSLSITLNVQLLTRVLSRLNKLLKKARIRTTSHSSTRKTKRVTRKIQKMMWHSQLWTTALLTKVNRRDLT